MKRERTTPMPDLVEELAHLLVTIRPLAEQLASDAHSAEDRWRLLEKTGGYSIFHTSNAVTRLCSDYKRAVKVAEREKDEEAIERGPTLTTAQLIKTLARLILAVRPVAEELASDDQREEDRQLLREKVGDADLRRTASLLNQLCGERARALIRGVRYRRPPSLPRGST